MAGQQQKKSFSISIKKKFPPRKFRSPGDGTSEAVTVPTTVQLRVFEKTLSQRSSVGLNLRLLLSRRSRLRYSGKCGKVSPVRKARPGLRNIQRTEWFQKSSWLFVWGKLDEQIDLSGSAEKWVVATIHRRYRDRNPVTIPYPFPLTTCTVLFGLHKVVTCTGVVRDGGGTVERRGKCQSNLLKKTEK